MEINGSIDSGNITFDFDEDDVRRALDLDDYIEEGCREYMESFDFSSHIDVSDEAQNLLDQYDGMNSPCSLGQSFEKAVWWAMSRSDKDTPTPSEEGVTLHEKYQEEIKRLVREEVRTILNMTVGRLEVQAKYRKVDDDPSLT